ncbi:MAG: hypothetical protein H7346_13525 [Burkholderiaceae bacterium]|nr:hypothetical protein [Burkholderiaceae bacterium]
MTAKNLSTVTTELIESYGNTAKNVIKAYRAGGERVVGYMDLRFESALKESRDHLSQGTVANARNAHKVFNGFYAKGVNVTANGADTVVNSVLKLAEKGVRRVAANAGKFEEKTGYATLSTVASAVVPAAVAVSRIVAQVEVRTGDLAGKIAGAKPASALRKARARKSA